jgi:hypothetical protein
MVRMKKSEITKLLGITWLICVCTLYTSLSHAGTITDNFASASINTRLWRPFNDSQHQRVFQEGGELRIQIDGASTGDEFGAGLEGRFLLKGDFVMTVDYRLITWPNANGVRLGFEGPNGGPGSDEIFMVKRRNEGANQAPWPENTYSADFNDGSGWAGNIFPTMDDHGSLKLTRVGSVLTGYFLQDGDWKQIAFLNCSGSRLEGWVGMTLWANSRTTVQTPNGLVNLFGGQNVEIAFDNFQVTYDQIRYTSTPVSSLLLLLLD